MNPLPKLDTATESALRDSIRRFGVIVPVLRDQHGVLVDGSNRVRIAAELGGRSPAEHVVQLPEDLDERAAALASINDARRPKMTPEQRREVVAALREAGHSQRAIAGAVGVHRNQVQRDLHHVDTLCPPGHRTVGVDGKSYPADRPAKRKLTLEQHDEIVRRVRSGETQHHLAAEFGVSQSTISIIVGERRNRPKGPASPAKPARASLDTKKGRIAAAAHARKLELLDAKLTGTAGAIAEGAIDVEYANAAMAANEFAETYRSISASLRTLRNFTALLKERIHES